jgi:hypothetical protein
MDTVILIVLLIANLVMAHRLKELKPPRPARELTPAKVHRLVRTWIEPNPVDEGWPGWRFQCTCGTVGMATNLKQGVFGSEENAVKQFVSHTALYASVDEDGWKNRYDQLQTQFEWYVQKCYCRHTNDELIEWRDK